MSLIRFRNLSVSFGGPSILENIDGFIDAGERVCLLGRNGTGKSTLLKLISGLIHADSGELEFEQAIKVAYMAQEHIGALDKTIFDVVADGLGDSARLIQDYHHAVQAVSEDHSDAAMARLEKAQHDVDAANAWHFSTEVESILSRMSLDGELQFEQLSGGMKRRVLLARAMVISPDCLILDEPTNHLDLEAIQWLEEQLLSFKGAVLFVTHDRVFMRKLATRILDLDRGVLNSYPGDYETYLRRKEEYLHAEAEENSRFDKKLAREEIWIRQGIKARRTRNEGRVRSLEKMREQRSHRRNKIGKVDMRVSTGDRSGKLIAEAENVNFSYQGVAIIRDFSATILRGDKIGVIGPNGAGKSTLLKLLLGQLVPDSGTIRSGTKQSVAYFDQMRAQLDEESTALDNVSHGREFIEINGKSKHVIGYLQDFLFAPERSRAPISMLSGGERNRLLLARLFSQPANILVLDEPTNDLDIETLELLEELMLEFDGTILLVSHDREIVNNVVTSTLVFEGDGIVNEYVGGYEDWLRQKKDKDKNKKSAVNKSPSAKQSDEKKSSAKLSYKDQRELDSLPKRLEELESEIDVLQSKMNDAGFYQQDKEEITRAQNELKELQEELSLAYSRWEALEALL